MPEYRLQIRLSREEYLRYYQGTASVILAKDTTGKLVQFPASSLRSYVTADGVAGSFLLVTDSNNKLVELVRL